MAVAQDGHDLEAQRRDHVTRLKTALQDEDDPLAVYVQFVQWITKNYPENDPQSGLSDVLKQATETFQSDSIYKNDLRYLKLWVLYARQLDIATAINMYASLARQHIGTSYSLLYEEYARSLERVGRTGDAEHVYRMGIKRQVRPVERLKTRYQDFKARNTPSTSKPSSSSAPVSAPTPAPAPAPTVEGASTKESRYALMLAPPPPGKRPEVLKYNTSLLWTPDGVEYCAAEARARSMGLLGKKWTPLPVGSTAPRGSATTSVRVAFDDEDDVTPRPRFGRKSLLNGEPTVTINTKEALADVFGMFNSPEKTLKLARPGSKHAPLRKVESLTTPKQPVVKVDAEKQALNSSHSGGFKIFVDEEPKSGRKENKPAPKFVPFVDSSTPAPPPKPFLATTFAPPKTPTSLQQDKGPIFSTVFTPASKSPLRDVYTEAIGKPQAKPLTHERAKSYQDVSSLSESNSDPPPPAKYAGFDENQKTPKVFCRPGEGENPFTPKPPSAFTPAPAFTPATTFTFATAFTPAAAFTPARAFVPFRDEPEPPLALAPVQVLQPVEPPASPLSSQSTGTSSVFSGVGVEQEDEDDYGSSFVEDEDFDQSMEEHDYETPLEEREEDDGTGGGYSSDVPLGGRFGQFNVMTPIKERTLEYTSTQSLYGTPTHRTQDSVPEEDEYDYEGSVLAEGDLAPEEGEGEEEDWHPAASGQPWKNLSQYQDDTTEHSRRMDDLQEHTGQLSLVEALKLSTSFHPPNPCNPFDPSVMSTVLSLLPSDSNYHDLRHQEAHMLDGLQKFAKKLRKTSSGSNHGGLDGGDTFPLSLDGEKYLVSGKLGEGGFGAVFQAVCAPNQDDDTGIDFDEDEDEEVKIFAIKVVRPRNLWEYHILRKLHAALPSSLRRSIVLPQSLFAFRDESFLVLEFGSQGMLLDVVTKAVTAGVSQQGACLDELLVVFFAVELLRLLEGMHSAGFIHGDLKIDNCLLRLEDVPGGASSWSGMYDPAGGGGWSYKGIKLIDFGRTINTRMFPVGQEFIADWTTDDRDCFEIREERAWTYQTDYFGLGGIVYCLLFGKYIEAGSITGVAGSYKIATPLKRYWQTEMWGEFFDLCLNPGRVGGGVLPISGELERVRKRMEGWLKGNCNRTSGTLKGLLKKVELSCLR